MTKFFKKHKKNVKYYTLSLIFSILTAFISSSILFFNKLILPGAYTFNPAFFFTCLSVICILMTASVVCRQKPHIARFFHDLFTVFEKGKLTFCSILCGVIVFFLTFIYVAKMPLDYPIHTDLAGRFDFSRLIPSLIDNSYPLWHVIVKLFELIFRIPLNYSAALTSALLVLYTYHISRKIFSENTYGVMSEVFAPILAAALMFVQPIYIPWFNKEQIYGQGSPNILYNPTNLVAKPFAIICVYLIIKLIIKSREEKIKPVEFIRLSIFALLSVLAKPSAIQVILPTLAVFLLILLIKSRGKDFLFCVYMTLSWIPALLWMAVVFYLNFVSESNSGGNGLALSFFDVWSVYSPCIPISILLVTLFPIAVLIFFGKKAAIQEKLGTFFGATAVLMGVLEYGLIMETGDRMLHGNFSWGYSMALGIFWTFAADMFFKSTSRKASGRLWSIAISLFVIYVMFGAYYFIATI